MKTIGFYSYGRKQSQRCPNKLLRPFGDTTLCDILLGKLKTVGGKDAFFGGYEEDFKAKTAQAGVRFLQRTEESVRVDEPITVCQHFLADVDYEYLVCVNGCLPFLKVETIQRFVEDVMRNDYQPCIAVVSRHNYFYDYDGKPLNFSVNLKNLNTKTVQPILEQANALYFFKREYFFEHGTYWDWNSVRVFEIDSKIEVLDVDTEEDFVIALNLFRALGEPANQLATGASSQ